MRLSRQLSVMTGWDLPAWSAGPTDPADVYAMAAGKGYEGVQVFLPDQVAAARAAGLSKVSAIAPTRTVAEIDSVIAMWDPDRAPAIDALVLHVGTGFESPVEASELLRRVVDGSQTYDVSVLVETHRGTLTQDPARTLALIEEFPGLGFCADLSHWYTGVEMVYGDLDAKLDLLGAVFDRCRMIHGRISDPGCIQVAVEADDDRPHVEHFRRMWTAIITSASAAGVDELPFVVELLPASANYARTVDRGAGPEEESDRWTQADIVWGVAAALEDRR